MESMRSYEKIQKIAAERDIQQSRLAAKLGLSQSTFNRYFNGKRTMKPEMLSRIAKLLDVPVAYLADEAIEEIPAGLSDDDRIILRVAHVLGPDEALRRLTAAAETGSEEKVKIVRVASLPPKPTEPADDCPSTDLAKNKDLARSKGR